jgi:6-phosphogluconolactonase
LNTAEDIANPSFLAIDSRKNLLATVNETMEFEGKATGAVSTFSIDQNNWELDFLSQTASGGGAPCYISLNKKGSLAFAANYMGGNVSVFPVSKDGELKPYSDLKQHSGSGPVTDRQQNPHAHSIVLSPDGKYALAADLGIDKVITYVIDEKNGTLNQTSVLTLKPGSGPRHLAFHPNKKFAFIISELNSTITSCAYDAKTGELSEIMSAGTLPEDYTGMNSCADIHVSPNGKFLYGSNRGHDSIVIFKINKRTGTLSFVGHQSVLGKTPRNFMIDPTGSFLLAANQDSNDIVVFKINDETGKLSVTGASVKVTKPVCLKMIRIKK